MPMTGTATKSQGPPRRSARCEDRAPDPRDLAPGYWLGTGSRVAGRARLLARARSSSRNADDGRGDRVAGPAQAERALRGPRPGPARSGSRLLAWNWKSCGGEGAAPRESALLVDECR